MFRAQPTFTPSGSGAAKSHPNPRLEFWLKERGILQRAGGCGLRRKAIEVPLAHLGEPGQGESVPSGRHLRVVAERRRIKDHERAGDLVAALIRLPHFNSTGGEFSAAEIEDSERIFHAAASVPPPGKEVKALIGARWSEGRS